MPNFSFVAARAKQEFKVNWSRINGPAAFGNYVIGLFAAASIWVTMVVDLGRTNESPVLWLTAGCVSTATSVAWLIAAKWFLRAKWLAGPALVLLAYAFAGLLRNLTLGAMCLLLGLSSPSGRIIISVLATLFLLIFANLTANRRIETLLLTKTLLVDRQKLIWLGASYDEKVVQAQRELHRKLETELYPAIRRVLEKLNPGRDSSNPEISQDLVETVSTVVRPICDHLSESSDSILEQLDEVATEPTELASDVKYSIHSTLRPFITLVGLMLIAATVSPALGRDSDFLKFAQLSVVGFAIVTVIKFSWPKKIDLVSAGLGLAVVSASYLLAYGLAFLALLHNGEASQTLVIQASFSVGAAVIMAMLSFSSQARHAALKQLQDQNQLLSQLISKLRRQIWLIRRNATWVLHGPIQSALISSAMALANDSITLQERTQIRERIETAVQALNDSQKLVPDLDSALKSIANVWSRSCQVSWLIDDSLVPHLDTDLDTVTCLVEVASEGVSNSIRHGKAKNVTLNFALDAHNSVLVEVVDDGLGLAHVAEPGHGSALFDEICVSWSRQDLNPGVLLRAKVVLSANQAVNSRL